MLLEISIFQSDCGDMTLFQTIQEVIGRIKDVYKRQPRHGILWVKDRFAS